MESVFDIAEKSAILKFTGSAGRRLPKRPGRMALTVSLSGRAGGALLSIERGLRAGSRRRNVV